MHGRRSNWHCAVPTHMYNVLVMNYLTHSVSFASVPFIAYFIYGGILFGALPWLQN